MRVLDRPRLEQGRSHLTLVIAYDGRADIVHAARRAVLEGGGPVKDMAIGSVGVDHAGP